MLHFNLFFPRDAKIAALEKTSQETERLMTEARNEKIRHMDELHDAQKKCADIEGRWEETLNGLLFKDYMCLPYYGINFSFNIRSSAV